MVDMMHGLSIQSPNHPVHSRLLKASFISLLLSFTLFPIAHLAVFGLPLYWSETALVFSIVLAGLSNPDWFTGRIFAIVSKEKPFFLFASLFLAGILVSYFINPHTLSGWGEIKSFYIFPVLFLIAITVWGETKKHLWQMAIAWLLGSMAAVIAGLSAASFGWYLYDGRLAGFYQSPNYLAVLIAPGVLLALQLFRASMNGKREKAILLLSLGFSLALLWLTQSYAVCFALGLAWLAALVLGNRSPRQFFWPAFLLLLIVGAFLAGERGSEKWHSLISGDDRSSLASRVIIWQSATKIATDTFPWGIGTGRFQEVYLDYQRFYPPYLEWAVPTSHNLYLHFLLEGGLLTLFGWLGCVGWALILATRALVVSRKSGNTPHFLILGITLLAFYLAYGLVDTPYMKNDLALAVWGSLGFILAAQKIKA